MPQAVHTAQKAVLAHQSQLELMLDANSNAVLASLHTTSLAKGDDGSSGVVQQGVQGGIQGSLRGCQGVTKGSLGAHLNAVPSELHATGGTACNMSDQPAQSDSNRKMYHSSGQHHPPQEASPNELGLERLDAAHTHRQLRHRGRSLSPQHESLLQLTVADKHSSAGDLSSQSDDSASSMSCMTDGQSRVALHKAGTPAWNQFPQQPDSVGSIAQLFMMRMRARLVLQVCAHYLIETVPLDSAM